ncbi:MAG: hypothetical protein ACLPWF_07075 [Bryobacteraceae bacterium]|jgi:hypothetical protein
MSSLLEKAMEKVVALPPDEQDAIASQILASLADEEDWKRRFVEKGDVIRRMALEETRQVIKQAIGFHIQGIRMNGGWLFLSRRSMSSQLKPRA